MTKLTAGVVKKVPVPGVAYSNQEFSAGLEVELPDDASAGEVQQRLRDMYALLGETVESEIAAATEAARRSGADDRTGDGRDDRRDRQDHNQQNGGNGWRNRQGNRDNGGYQSDYHRGNGSRQGGSWRRNGNNGNGNGRGGQASQSQVKAVFAIAKDQGIDRRDIVERIEDQFGVRRVEDLDVRQASQLIEQLKAA